MTQVSSLLSVQPVIFNSHSKHSSFPPGLFCLSALGTIHVHKQGFHENSTTRVIISQVGKSQKGHHEPGPHNLKYHQTQGLGCTPFCKPKGKLPFATLQCMCFSPFPCSLPPLAPSSFTSPTLMKQDSHTQQQQNYSKSKSMQVLLSQYEAVTASKG